MDFAIPVDQNENKRMRKDWQILGLYQRIKNAGEHEGDYSTKSNFCSWNGSQRLGKGTNRVHPDYRIVENGQNTETNPEDLRKLAVTHILLKEKTTSQRWNEKKLVNSEIIKLNPNSLSIRTALSSGFLLNYLKNIKVQNELQKRTNLL